MGEWGRSIDRMKLAATLAVAAAAVGCAMPTGAPVDAGGTPISADDGPVGPAGAGADASSPAMGPADLLNVGADQPFSQPASTVNVFGEVDGIGPTSFSVAGKAGFQQHTFVDEGYDADPDVSPDGKWLVFSSTRHSEHPEIYLQRVEGLAVTQLTSEPGDDAFPRFSPDGKRITFASNRAGNWDIYVMDVDGKNVEPVTRSQAQEIHPSFSPDGKRLVYSALGSRSGQWELWTVDLTNMERRMIGYGLFPEWCPRPDRDVIAFQRARQRGTRWFSAWTLDLIDGEAKHVTEVAFSTNAAIVAPTWSEDGRRLAFCTISNPAEAETKTNVAGGIAAKGGVTDVWTVNLDGTDRKRLSDGRGVNATPTWSPDGQVYFVSDRGGSESIWSIAAGKPRGGGTATAAWPSYPDDAPPAPAANAKKTQADGVFGSEPTASVNSGNP